MKYEILWMENKTTSTGKTFAEAKLKDEQGNITEKATLWGSSWIPMPMNGDEVEGELQVKQNGQYTNTTLYPPKKASSGAYRASGAGIKVAQERKAEFIEKAQDKKEESIAYFSSLNAAINLVCHHPYYRESTGEAELIQRIIGLRERFYKEWQKHEPNPF